MSKKENKNKKDIDLDNLWDFSADVVLQVAFEMRRNGIDPTNENEALYSGECGQEIVYNMLKELMCK